MEHSEIGAVMARGKLTPEELDQRVYELALRHRQWTTAEAAGLLGASEGEVEEAVDRLERVGLLRPSPRTEAGYAAVAPEIALTRLFALEDRQLVRHQEQMAHTREAISSVMRDYLGLRSPQGRSLEVEALPTIEQEESFLDRVVDLARQDVWLMHVGSAPTAPVLDEMLLRYLGMLGSGIAVHALFLHQHARDRLMSGYLKELTQAGAQVRVAANLPQRMLIVDRDLAMVPVDPENSARGFWGVHGTELVPALRAVYEHCWIAATPFTVEAVADSPAQRPSVVEDVVIQMLAEGMKDEAIARRLGVSSRTLSRMISTLLDRLGVQSRFQAALELGRRGWLGAPQADALAHEGAA
ncbi:helix-turn-helix domain-containing protein [Streptomyces sp. NPDC059496]|uniref:helix-turn-helix transcriptional regulator n=1 Tax=Streptomyces sp. NPDC059496 TaxID=3346851 RepID=UPI0036A9BF89